MANNYRKGSMKAAEQKSNTIFKVVAGVAYLAIILLLLGVGNTFFGGYFERAPMYANALGIIAIIASYFLLYKFMDADVKIWHMILVFILLALGIGAACGFNFDLHGIE